MVLCWAVCAVQLGVVLCITVWCGDVQFSVVLYSVGLCGAVQCMVVWCCAESALHVSCGDSLSPKVASRCLGSLHCTSLATLRYMYRTGPFSIVQGSLI